MESSLGMDRLRGATSMGVVEILEVVGELCAWEMSKKRRKLPMRNLISRMGWRIFMAYFEDKSLSFQ